MKDENNKSQIFESGRFGLIVSLPANNVEIAKAAEAGGADSLKIHINVLHAASGTSFGSLEKEKDNILAIVQAVKIPVGIMPGAENPASFDEMLILEEMGISFFDIYISDMPVSYMNLKKMKGMPALSSEWHKNDPKLLKKAGFKMLEASIVHHSKYGTPLVLSDLLNYSYIAGKFEGAVIVPTQKAIKPEEIALLADADVAGIMIGKIVTGSTASEIEAATSLFRKVIEKI